MQTPDALRYMFTEIRRIGHETVDGLSREQLLWRPDQASNSIAWLVWHLARVQDDHGAEIAGTEQVWTSGGWAERFGLPAGYTHMGYGHEPDEVAAVRPADAGVLTGYLDRVTDATLRYLDTTGGDDFERVIDRSFDPPVTVGVRLASVVMDDLQHAGQAAYLRGLAERSGIGS